MPISHTYLFKRCWEFLPLADVGSLPARIRGIYVLYREGAGDSRNVVYVGMARGEQSGAKGRLVQHSKKKRTKWTHFSVFEVWDNISAAQVVELEGLFRHLYRKDQNANELNLQKAYAPLTRLRRDTKRELA